MKRRKKNSSTSDLSSDSLSPKKHIPNGFSEEYRSSPETVYNSTFHSILPNPMTTSNGHIINDNDGLKSSEHEINGLSSMDISQNGSMLSGDSQSPTRTTIANHHFDDSDSTSSANKSQRQPRTPEDFYLFCQFILEYANYNEMCDQEVCLHCIVLYDDEQFNRCFEWDRIHRYSSIQPNHNTFQDIMNCSSFTQTTWFLPFEC